MAIIDEIKGVFDQNSNAWLTSSQVYEQIDNNVFGENKMGDTGKKNQVGRDLSARYKHLFEVDSSDSRKYKYRLKTTGADDTMNANSQDDGMPIGSYSKPVWGDIVSSIQKSGLKISEKLLKRYHTSLQVRGFVILSGISGTGKTWLTEAYANAVKAEYCIIPVAPNWTSNEDILGYFNPFGENGGMYHDTEFSNFLRLAAEDYQNAASKDLVPTPYHLILDEMNLAPVEYYFAKFLSAMELRARNIVAPISLGPGEEVLLTPNLYFIGTVNVDETTHGFADKVYDRAQIIELTISREDVSEHLMGQPYADIVLKCWDSIEEIAPFAFRTLDDMKKYTETAAELGVPWQIAVDKQILQKVLPKINGFDSRVESALKSIIDIAIDADLSATRAKAEYMLKGYQAYGFTSFFQN